MSQPDIQLSSLTIGQPLPHALYGPDGVMLLRDGIRVTAAFIDKLRERGLTAVRATAEADVPAAAPPVGPTAPVDPRTPPAPAPELEATDAPAPPRLDAEAFFAELPRAQAAFGKALGHYAAIAPDLLGGRLDHAGPAYELVESFGPTLNKDPVLLAMLLRAGRQLDPARHAHGLRASLLSMALGRHLGLDATQLRDAGVAALLHDLGMARVGVACDTLPRKLTDAERREVGRHPELTLDLLNRLRGVGTAVRHAAFQVHERRDGRGYPCARQPMFVSPLAKIVAVADAYAALTATRSWRPAFSGHDAVKTVLTDTRAGRFDRTATRTLLDALSLFPPGTRVALSDGRSAQTLRGVPGHNLRPVVVVLKMDGTPGRREVDLSAEGQPEITAVLPDPPGATDTAAA